MGGRAIPIEDRMRHTTPRSIELDAAKYDKEHGGSTVKALLLCARGLALCAQKIHELKPQGTNAGREQTSTRKKRK